MTLKELETQYTSLTSETGSTFIKSIHAAYKDEGITTLSLQGFLERIITGFSSEGKRISTSHTKLSSNDRDLITLYGRIVGAMMIILQESRSYSNLKDKTLLFITYAASVVKTKYDYATIFIDALNYRIIDTGLDWRSLCDAKSLDILCYKLSEGIRFDKSYQEPFLFTGNGKVECSRGCIHLFSSSIGDYGNKAFSVFEDRIEVIPRNVRDERLKISEQDDVDALSRFYDSFIKTQEESNRALYKEKEYKEGDVVDVKVTVVEEDPMNLICEIIKLGEPVNGIIINEELIKGIWTKDLTKYIYEGDCIRNAVIIGKNENDFIISIRDAYSAFALKLAREDYQNSKVMEARLIEIKKGWHGGRITWMTPRGYPGLSLPIEGQDLGPGKEYVLTIQNIQQSGSSYYINLSPPKYGYQTIDYHIESDEDVLADFFSPYESIISELQEKVSENRSKEKDIIRMLASVLVNRSSLKSSLNTYRQKLVSLFLLKLIGDKEEFENLLPETYFLRYCISFAQGNKVPSSYAYNLPKINEQILHLLSMWDSLNEDILKLAQTFTKDSIPEKISSLLLSRDLANRFKDEVKVDDDLIRKKVCSLLGVANLFKNNSASRNGKYGNVEGQEVEYKSSYIYRNDDKGPDIDYQGRGQVFEAVCGFLNANGGVVYLGVNNDGDPITADDYGLNADITWLQDNYKTISGMRLRQLGHPINEVKDLDSYVQFLNSEKELYFKESLWENIRIEVSADADAITITVFPSDYEIAFLYRDKTCVEGSAFVRDGGRTVLMTEKQQERRLMSLKRISKEIGFAVVIQKAINEQRKLLFKGYASGNSGEVKDRLVVPINLFYNDENVYCFDLISRKYKQFRLHRITDIETLPDKYPLQEMPPKKADVFRWLDEGKKRYHIKLRMAIGAKNYLLEEYSCAEKLPQSELYEDKNDKWILDTYVNGLDAVRRFYLGLADKIEIMDTEDSEELKANIKAFISNNIT